jgi:16S rRNA processing protein RimM
MTEGSTPTPSAVPPQKRERRRRKSASASPSPSASPSGSQPVRTTENIHRNRAIHVPDGHMAVGRIVGMHGLNGELRVELHTDFPERFASGETLWLGEALVAKTVQTAREHKGMILLTLADVTSRDEAEALRQEWLFIPDDAAMALPEGEYWVHDIIGLAVVDEAGQPVGKVTDILQTGANDVYIITPVAGVNRDKELLIPAIAEVVQSVDLASGTLTIRIVPGLIDEWNPIDRTRQGMIYRSEQ